MNPYTVLLFGPLRDKFDSGKLTIEMPENSSIEDLLNHLGVDSDYVKTAIGGEICRFPHDWKRDLKLPYFHRFQAVNHAQS